MLRLVKMRFYGSKCIISMVILLVLAVARWGSPFTYLPPNQSTGTGPTSTIHLEQSSRSTNSDVTMTTHIRFLKVHKCASTTMQNLFFRFALRHYLTIALPQHGNFINAAQKIIWPSKTIGHYDIFACHTRYSKTWFDALPIPANAVNIAIVREPRERIISQAYKSRDGGVTYLRKVPNENYIQNLLRYPEKYDKEMFSPTRNRMAMDFGFYPNITSNEKRKIKQYLQFIEKEFRLVLVVERFHESLVLMKRSLNWGLQDIIYRVAHAFEHENVSLSNEDILRMKELNFLDFAIYENFTEVFDRIITNQTRDFHDEVLHLDSTIRVVSEFCDSSTANELEIKESKWNQKFILTSSECHLMKTAELRFIASLRRRHYKYFSTT